MGDWDYGRANGLWGDDGIPYDVKYGRSSSRRNSKKSSKTKSKSKTKRYNSSEQMAYDNGFRAVYDENSYNGRYFIKDDKIWIHDIAALKYRLDTDSDYRLKKIGYDVDTYYKLH